MCWWLWGRLLQWSAAVLALGAIGAWSSAGAADRSAHYPDVWGTIVSEFGDLTHMIGALRRANGEVSIFYRMERDDGGQYLERIVMLDFFSQHESIIKEGIFDRQSDALDFAHTGTQEVLKIPDLCCKDEIPRASVSAPTFGGYEFQNLQGSLSIAIRNWDCLLCDHFVLRIGTGARSRLVARQLIHFFKAPWSYSWMEVKPYRHFYQIQTALAHPERYVPLADGSVIIFSSSRVIFRMDRNGRARFIEQAPELLQIEIPLHGDIDRFGLTEPFVGEHFPNADASIETNCTFVPVYRAYNQLRVKQGKPPWRFAKYPDCGDPNRGASAAPAPLR
jgi:hypothetical protein